jgi:hypothetical protein
VHGKPVLFTPQKKKKQKTPTGELKKRKILHINRFTCNWRMKIQSFFFFFRCQLRGMQKKKKVAETKKNQSDKTTKKQQR